jgi:glutaminyl-peptide cyclotransferase
MKAAAIFFLACLLGAMAGCSDTLPPFDDATAVWREFDGQQALDHTAAIVAMGPRPPASEALEKSRAYIEETLRTSGWQVKRHVFTDQTPNGPVEFVNLRARFGVEDGEAIWNRSVTVLLCSHYDTKPYRDLTFVGANDPGSSMGALIESARALGKTPTLARRLELVFFDGEEAFGPNITPTDGLYGSREYAREFLRRAKPETRPRWGVLLDMVGDKDFKIELPADTPPDLMRLVLDSAESLGHRAKFGVSRTSIIDDHVPLNVEGVPTVDLIDFDYDYWHTPADTLDKLSAESLEITGQTALLLIERHLVR